MKSGYGILYNPQGVEVKSCNWEFDKPSIWNSINSINIVYHFCVFFVLALASENAL